jgi:hypothetical protein
MRLVLMRRGLGFTSPIEFLKFTLHDEIFTSIGNWIEWSHAYVPTYIYTHVY